MTKTDETDARVATLEAIVRGRRTAKLLRDPAAAAADGDAALTDEQRASLDAMIELAGTAPFHKRAHERHRDGALDSVVPWRLHVLERAACRALLREIERRGESDPDPKWARAAGSKIPALIAAAGALVQVTWLPDPPKPEAADAIADNDVEHVAAASAAVQTLLLAAEAHGWHGYWSSGGALREPEIFDLLGIDRAQRLLGAIFLAPPGAPFDRNVPGGLRDQRGETGDWSRRVTLD